MCVEESFLSFFQFHQKGAASFVKVIMQQLPKDEIAAVMVEHWNGVQHRIYEKNKQAVFINYDNYSLNLVGVHAARQDTEMVSFL